MCPDAALAWAISPDRDLLAGRSARHHRSVRLASLLVLFHRLTEAKAFTIHLKDFAVVRKAVQQSGCHAFALKDLPPVAERQIARQQQAAAFVAIGENLKQQFCSAATKRQVTQFVHDQQISAIQLSQKAVEQVRLLLLFEQVDESCSREEADLVSLATRSGGE